ncbi:TPA: hypothetical protein ACJGUQ_003635 [Salmonella enterica subsp. enterica serovar Ball]
MEKGIFHHTLISLSHLSITALLFLLSYDAQAVRYAKGLNAKTEFQLSGKLTNISVGSIYTLTSTLSSATGVIQCNYTGEGRPEDNEPFQYYRSTFGTSMGNEWYSLNEYLSYQITGPDGTPSGTWKYRVAASACNYKRGFEQENINQFSAAYPVTVKIRVDRIPATGTIVAPTVQLGYYSRAHTDSKSVPPSMNPPNFSTFDIMLTGGTIIPEVHCSTTPTSLNIYMEGSANKRMEDTTTFRMKCDKVTRIKMEVRSTASATTSEDCSLVTLKSGASTKNACVKLHHSGQSGKEITVDFGTNISENIAVNTVLNKLPPGQYQGSTILIATVE